MIWVWFILSAICYAAGELLSKKWASNQFSLGYLLIPFTYAVGTVFWLQTMLIQNKLIVNSIVYLILAAIATASIGLAFGERLPFHSIVGLVLGVVAVILLTV